MKFIKYCLLLLLPLMLVGCYDKRELDNLAYVVGIGADIGSGDNIKITYQVAIPVKIAGEGNTSGKETFTTYTVDASSLYMGNSILNSMTSKEINLSHVKVVVYSEEFAKNGLKGHVNSLVRNVAIRPLASIVICRGSAENFLKQITPVLEVSPARYYDLILSSFNYTSESAGSELLDFYASAQSIDREPFAIISETSNKASGDNESYMKLAGLAVFNGLKMVGEIDSSLVKAHLLVTDSLKEGAILIDDVEDANDKVTLILKQTRAPKFDISLNDASPHVKITLYVDAHLNSTSAATNYLSDDNKHKLNIALEEKIASMVYEYLNQIQSLNSDIAGFGRYARKNFLTWEEFKNYNWEEKFKDATFEVETNVSLDVYQIIFHDIPEN